MGGAFALALDLIGPHSFEMSPLRVLPLAVSTGCSAYDARYAALLPDDFISA